MKKLSVFFIIIASSVITAFFSCKPEPPPPLPPPPGNEVPIANAGYDQTIILPKDSVVLDGTASKDPNGTISHYQWSKIAGPVSYDIIASTSVQTLVKYLVEGTYHFELMVTDNGGLTAKATVKITVLPAIIINGCNENLRPLINVSLTQIGTLSEPRIPYVATASNKIVFAGGPYINGPWYYNSLSVDIYDLNSKTWSRAALSKEREGIATVSCGNKIFFAGGGFWEWAFPNIDIYDVSTNTWSRSDLSIPRSYLTAATVGNKVFFAGGFTDGWQASSYVDIYDLSTNTWSTAALSQPRFSLSAVTVGDKIYFAGGIDEQGNNSTRVDIYNNTTNSWSTSALQEISGLISGVAFENNIYWGGISQEHKTGNVEIWNTADGSVTVNCITYSRYSPIAAVKNTDIIFLTSADWNNEIDFIGNLSNQFDIYNTITRQWSIGVLPQPIISPGIVSVNNSLYMGGGRTEKYGCTDKVYMLNW